MDILSNMVAVGPLREHLAGLRRMVAAGEVRPPQIERMPLGEVARAHERLQAGHVRGKIVLDIADPQGW